MINFTKYFIAIVVTLLLSNSAFCQEKRLARADEDFERYAFVDARKIYLSVAKSGYSSADLYKKLGDSYYFNGELKQALPWYDKLISDYPDSIEPEYLFRYAQGLKNAERYDDADRIMDQFIGLTGGDKRAASFMKTRDYLKFIEMQSGKFKVVKVGINSSYSDHAPSFNHKGQLVFASSRSGKSGSMVKTLHEWDEMPFLDLFISDISTSNVVLSAPKKIKGKVNTRFHESSTTFSADGTTVYFTRNNFTKKRLVTNETGTTLLKLYKATLDGERWVDIEELPFNSNEYSVAHPALSPDGTKLYFASDMSGGRGLSDLYVVDIYEDGSYGEPKSLGDRINTEGRETFPYVSDSGRLYFASDGHVGLGGLDVFVAVPDVVGFSVPYNVGRPVNSASDDFTFVLKEETKIGYFASNRSRGNDDIYSFKQIEELITSCQQYVSGVVTDAVTRKFIADAEIILLDENNQEIERTITDSKGNYKFQLECERSYVVRAVKQDYKPTEALLGTNTILEYEHKLPLQLGEGGLDSKEVRPGDDLAKLLQLQVIYFDLNKSYIRPDAEIELQKIIAVMNEYPELKIQVRSHTDSRSDDGYNMKLSERRAKSTVKYIIKKGGINRNRISGKGYGETTLINRCTNGVDCPEKDHQLNRRSEFIVIAQ